MIWPFNRKGKKNKAEASESKLDSRESSVDSSGSKADSSESKMDSLDLKLMRETVDISNRESRIAYITHLCDEIITAKKECENVKFEYGQVTSNLKDIQLIDQALPEDKEVLIDIADGIYQLTKVRERLQGQRYKITHEQKRAIEELEHTIEDDIIVLKEEEAFLVKIKTDLGQLGAEKSSLLNEKKEIISKQGVLKILSKCMAGILFSFMLLLIIVWQFYSVDITIPFIGLIGFCFAIIAYIMYESVKNRRGMVMIEKKCDRAVLLINRTKIKYVNSVKLIDYMCSKYRVRNGMDLEFVYGQFVKMKKEIAKQQDSTRLLGDYQKILEKELEKIGVKDREIWYFQAHALIDPREMVEVRHYLNTQRQKLRARIDFNSDLMEKCMSELENIQNKKPEYKEDVELILSQRH